MTLSDPAALVARCLSGDDAARAEFVNCYDGLLRRAVQRRLDRYHPRGAFASESDDICHEIYAKLFNDRCRALSGVRDARSLDAWLVTVAQNQTVSYMRKRLALGQAEEVRVMEAPAPYGHGPENQAIQNEGRERVRAALDRLDAKDRLMLQLFYLHTQKYSEIAETLGMNINTVASRLMRAKERLRDFLSETDR